MFGDTTAWLWLGVVAVGAYHGLNPAMGWSLAVASGLAHRRDASVFATFVPLGAGHLLAMGLVLVPFALLSWVLTWGREIRIGAGVLVVGSGLIAAWLVYRHLGLRALRSVWFDLDLVWALSLIASGCAAVAMALLSVPVDRV